MTICRRIVAPRQAPPPPTPPIIADADEATVLEIVREGLRNNRVDLFVQPIVSLPQRKHRHYECFSRIRAGDGHMITPEQYLAIAEREHALAAAALVPPVYKALLLNPRAYTRHRSCSRDTAGGYPATTARWQQQQGRPNPAMPCTKSMVA